MIYAKKVEILDDFHNLRKGCTIEMKPATLLVGDQGCGKSTLLHLMTSGSKIIKVYLSRDANNKGVETYYFDSESMNPRIQGMDDFTNPNGSSRGIGLGAGLSSRFMSHGEVLQKFTVLGVKQAKACIVFLDEPESGLSL